MRRTPYFSNTCVVNEGEFSTYFFLDTYITNKVEILSSIEEEPLLPAIRLRKKHKPLLSSSIQSNSCSASNNSETP